MRKTKLEKILTGFREMKERAVQSGGGKEKYSLVLHVRERQLK